MPKWKRIKLDEFKFPEVVSYTKEYIKFHGQLPQGVKLYKTEENKNGHIMDCLKDDIIGVGEKFTGQVREFYNNGISLLIPKETKLAEPIRVEFNMDEENPMVIDQNIIIAGANSQVTLIFDYSTDEGVKAFHNGITKVYAEENSIVNIIKIQRLNDSSHNFDSNVAFVKGKGKVNWISIELGSHISGVNYRTYLENPVSEGNVDSIYLGDGNRRMDLEYTMVHKGARSISNIESHGVLMDSSEKVFRGNLDFKKGAKHSSGREVEYVILLDPTVKSHSIPALLCDEDDIEGEHAASAGQIHENQLFYLMSRGLTERESKKLIVEASFRPVLDKLPLEDLREIVRTEIDRRLLYV